MIFARTFSNADKTYIYPSSGDIGFDPEPPGGEDPGSTKHSQNQEQSKTTLQVENILTNELKETDSSMLSLDSSNSDQEVEPTEVHIRDKIGQVENGDFILKALKSKKHQTSKSHQTTQEVAQKMQSNYRRNSDGALEMINHDQLKKEKKVFASVMKQFGSALFTGKSLADVSLPVSIFESQSQLEREARSLSYAPYFLQKAGEVTDPFEQFKLGIAHYISSLHLKVNPQKPFNPIIGETFQGTIGGCPIYLEQISHHPPKGALQLVGKDFTVEGIIDSHAIMSLNSVKTKHLGHTKIIFKNTGTVIKGQYPSGLVSGTTMSKRTFQFIDKFYIFDVENRYYCEIGFGDHSSAKKSKQTKDEFHGTIWKINEVFADRLRQAAEQGYDFAQLKFKEKEHSAAKVESIEGSWVKSLSIGGQVYWTFGVPLPYRLEYVGNSLPSDSNYRLDVLHMKLNNEEEAQRRKEELEEAQRRDQKLREKNDKNKKKGLHN